MGNVKKATITLSLEVKDGELSEIDFDVIRDDAHKRLDESLDHLFKEAPNPSLDAKPENHA